MTDKLIPDLKKKKEVITGSEGVNVETEYEPMISSGGWQPIFGGDCGMVS